MGLPFPESAGGFGATAVEAAIVAGELGRAGLDTAYAESLVATALLVEAGQTALVEAVAAGSALVVPALAEPGRAWTTTTSTVKAEPGGGADAGP